MESVRTLRIRFLEYRERVPSLETWRDFQLDILEAVRSCPSPSRESIWTILGDGFWFERDLNLVATLIEAALIELERHHAAAGSAIPRE